MALLRRIEAARTAAGSVARLAVTGTALAAAPAVVAAGLLAEPTRAAGRLARGAAAPTAAVAGGSLHLARSAAEAGTRAVGTLVTGADPIPEGHVRHLGDVGPSMVEARTHRHPRRVGADRHPRRVWADRQHVHIEVEAPAAEDRSEVRRALRRHLERLEGVQWATVND